MHDFTQLYQALALAEEQLLYEATPYFQQAKDYHLIEETIIAYPVRVLQLLDKFSLEVPLSANE